MVQPSVGLGENEGVGENIVLSHLQAKALNLCNLLSWPVVTMLCFPPSKCVQWGAGPFSCTEAK